MKPLSPGRSVSFDTPNDWRGLRIIVLMVYVFIARMLYKVSVVFTGLFGRRMLSFSGVPSLANSLAGNGLRNRPVFLWRPLFRHCRIFLHNFHRNFMKSSRRMFFEGVYFASIAAFEAFRNFGGQLLIDVCAPRCSFKKHGRCHWKLQELALCWEQAGQQWLAQLEFSLDFDSLF